MATRVATKAPSRRREVAPRVQVAGMQRSRLLAAAVVMVSELGWSGATVARITARARVSRRTFYDLFANREDCLLAVLNDTVETITNELAAAGVDGLSWRERVREGLWGILCFLDREPVLARLCVVASASGSQRVLERRQEILAGLASVVGEGRVESARGSDLPPLIAEGAVGAALGIIYKRLLDTHNEEPLSGLLGDLMGMIVLPYLGPGVARQECSRPAPLTSSSEESPAKPGRGDGGRDPLAGIPMRLTYRTARVLDCVAGTPGISNRAVAEHAGVSDQGQISKILARLERLDLLANTGEGHSKGEANAWHLTALGERVTAQLNLGQHTEHAQNTR
jgi:AcrR family transcriptional regulator